MRTKGFTLIELMIVVAIIGILSMFALPSYQDYTKRTYVAEGINLANGVKATITEYYSTKGDWPHTNAQAGLPNGATITGQAVGAIWVTDAEEAAVKKRVGFINIFFNEKVVPNHDPIPTTEPADLNAVYAYNNVLILSTVGGMNESSIQWRCFMRGSNLQLKWLPANCRSKLK